MDMEDIFGLLFFLAFAAFGMFSNWKKQQEEEKKRLENPRKARPEDLPEATRRMLYGEKDAPIQTAQPRQAERPTAPPFVTPGPQVPMPRKTQPPIQEQVPFPREYQAPPLRPDTGLPPSIPQKAPSMPEAWRQAQADREELEQKIIIEQERQREIQRKILASTLQGRVEQRLTTQKAPNHTPIKQKKTSPQRPVIPTSRIVPLFQNLNNVRTGIILKEVLGPPKGMQRY